MDLKDYNELIKKENLTNDEIEALTTFYEEDALTNKAYIEDFYHFYLHRILPLGRSEYLNQVLIFICQKYTYLMPDDYPFLFCLYFVEADFYFLKDALGQSLHYINKMIDLENVPYRYKISAITYALTTLYKAKLYKEAIKYIDLYYELREKEKIDAELNVAILLDAADIFAMLKDYDRFKSALDEVNLFIKQSDSDTMKVLSFYKDMHELNYQIQFKLPLDIEKLRSLMENMQTSNIYTDEYAMILIPVLNEAKNHLNKEEILKFASTIMKNEASATNRLDLYQFIFEELKPNKNEYYEGLYNQYVLELKEYYKDARMIKEREIKAEMEAHNFQISYKNLMSKYERDPLTGCYNRIILNDIENEVLSENDFILFFDINNLKKINDNFGHHNGDKYIKAFADLLIEKFSKHGKCIRYGGDEFLVYIKSNKLDHILALVDEMNSEALKTNPFNEITLSFSYGVASGPKKIMEAINVADERMYNYKKSNKEIIKFA